MKSLENDRVYRYPSTKKVILLETPDGHITYDAIGRISQREYQR